MKFIDTVSVGVFGFFSVFSGSAFATNLEKMVPAHAELRGVTSFCAKAQTCPLSGTVVQLWITLPGCFDELGAVTWKTQKIGESKLKVIVDAKSVEVPESQGTHCFVPNVREFEIRLPGNVFVDSQILLENAHTFE